MKKHIAVITGASSGIGAEFARQLDDVGLKEYAPDEFWLIARREDRLHQLADTLSVPSRVLPLDLTDPEAVQNYAQLLRDEEVCVDWLICAAGFGKMGSFDEVSPRDVEDMIDLNVKALVHMTYATLPFMERGSHIVELGSSSSFFPLPYFNIYASTKAFVVHFAAGLHEELRPRGISVTSVSPGWVKTDFFSVAEQGSAHQPRQYKPMFSAEAVVRTALRDASRGRMTSVCGLFPKLHRLAGKILPNRILQAMWKNMRGE